MVASISMGSPENRVDRFSLGGLAFDTYYIMSYYKRGIKKLPNYLSQRKISYLHLSGLIRANPMAVEYAIKNIGVVWDVARARDSNIVWGQCKQCT